MQGTASKQPDRPSKEEWDTSIPEPLRLYMTTREPTLCACTR
jgi:hypothetical protein